MNLIADIGNSSCKLAFMVNGEVKAIHRIENIDTLQLAQILPKEKKIDKAIVSSVGMPAEQFAKLLSPFSPSLLVFNAETKTPLTIDYESRATLGADRLAAAVGANYLFPNRTVLVVDFGTAITIDLVSNDAHFKGGNISPGLTTRFKALHHFTQRLPLLETSIDEVPLLGQSTQQAIKAGVQKGIEFEIEGYINQLSAIYPDLLILFTGGDAELFARTLKNNIFADSFLVLKGLNRILEYNA